jgi:hypothetical protein
LWSKFTTMTMFEQAQQDFKAGKLKVPHVSVGGLPIDYFNYQLATHKFNLGLMAKGLTFRNISFTQIKKYYGLKGKSAKDCLEQFDAIFTEYKEKFALELKEAMLKAQLN